MKTRHSPLLVTLQAIGVAWSVLLADWWHARPRLRDTLRGMWNVAAGLVEMYLRHRRDDRAFDKAHPVHDDETFDESRSLGFLAAIAIVAVLGAFTVLWPEVRQ